MTRDEQDSIEGRYRPGLPDAAMLERNLLGVPLFVLNPKASRTNQKLLYEWSDKDGRRSIFTFERPDDTPYPLPVHTAILDVFLAMFAHNFDARGQLRFRFADVLRNAGKKSNATSSLAAAYETIHRYARCQARWHYAWKGEVQTWHGPIIIGEDVWELTKDGERLKRNPRRSSDPSTWHLIQFHPHIVDSIKNGFSRCMISEALKGGMSAPAFCVYRYFYGFNDKSDIRRTWRQLMAAFPWRGRESRFKPWLESQLQELEQRHYLEWFDLSEDWVRVKCSPLQQVKASKQLELFKFPS